MAIWEWRTKLPDWFLTFGQPFASDNLDWRFWGCEPADLSYIVIEIVLRRERGRPIVLHK